MKKKIPVDSQQLEKYLKESPFPFIRLKDSNGNVLVAFNQRKAEIEGKIKEVVKKINSQMCPDGIYFLEYKNVTAGKNESFPVSKGNVQEEEMHKAIEIEETKKVNTVTESKMTVDEIISMKVENERLKAENERLQKENTDLLTELDGVEEISEGGGNNFESLFWENIAPKLIDKYFQNEERKILAMESMTRDRQSNLSETKTPQQELIETIKNGTVEELQQLILQAKSLGPEQEKTVVELIFKYRNNTSGVFTHNEV